MQNSGIQWAEPRDLDLDNLPPGVSKAAILKSLVVHHNAGIHVAMADGNVLFISPKVSNRRLEALTTAAGKENAKVDELRDEPETQ